MNIFVLDRDPIQAAKYMCDKHVVKMILESCQLLSTAHRVLDGTKIEAITPKNRKYTRYIMDGNLENFLYKSTMINHPCSIWCRESSINYKWLATHAVELIHQYGSRYGKIHASEELTNWLYNNFPKNIQKAHLTTFVLAMPDQYKCSNAVLSYQNYYINEKYRFAKWKDGNIPFWYSEGVKNKHAVNAA